MPPTTTNELPHFEVAQALTDARKRYEKIVRGDRSKIRIAGFALLAVGALQAGIALWAWFKGNFATPLRIPWVAQGGLSMVFGVLALANSFTACIFAAILHGIGAVVSFRTGDTIAVAIEIAVVVVSVRGLLGVMATNNRLANPEASDPLSAYYNAFVRLLVRVMKADGHLDDRERQRIAEFCDVMQLTGYEQQRVINAAAGEWVDVSAAAQSYLRHATQLGLRQPERQLIIGALAIAAADGVLASEEEGVLGELAQAVGMPDQELRTMIEQERATIGELDELHARLVLNVEPSDGLPQIQRSYKALMHEFDEARFAHLGSRLSEHIKQRREVIQRAFRLLTSSSHGSGEEEASTGS